MIFALIVMGSRLRNKVMGQVQYTCPMCRQYSYHVVTRSQYWFTVYFLPVIPLKKTYISRCNFCGYEQRVDEKQVRAWFP
ncbi:MAG TPA: zinc-ribbon domain-containing protein [Ktedonobacteraceae bacterium]|jgi:C4-type Zn-finger protein|nr:zinc-ribbon domain-containing protein [Ktedonobacteraceae bacterium]